MTGDAETLAVELHRTENSAATPGLSCSECRRSARIILASDWLAAVRDEATRQALRDAADEVHIAALWCAKMSRFHQVNASDRMLIVEADIRDRAAALPAAPSREGES